VPATATVTASIAEADGSVPTSSRSGSGGEAGGLQMDNISMQQYRYSKIQQGNKFIPRRLDYMRLPFAHHPTTLRDQRQSFGQLHGWSGEVVPSRLSFGFLFCQGALTFNGLAAGQSLSCLSRLCLGCGAGEKGVRLRDVGLWRVALVQLCVSLHKVQLAVAAQQNLFSIKSSRVLTGFGGFCAENSCGTLGTASTSSSTRLTRVSAASSDSSSAHIREESSAPMYLKPKVWRCWSGWIRRLKKENITDAPVIPISF
jgi:hypothetical protein